MNFTEAVRLMAKGNKLRRSTWVPISWVIYNTNKLWFEDMNGNIWNPTMGSFKATDWELFG